MYSVKVQGRDDVVELLDDSERSNFLTYESPFYFNTDNRIRGNQIILDWLASKASPRITDMLGASTSLTARKAVCPISSATENSGTENTDPVASKARDDLKGSWF
jgi:hypothetical protein